MNGKACFLLGKRNFKGICLGKREKGFGACNWGEGGRMGIKDNLYT